MKSQPGADCVVNVYNVWLSGIPGVIVAVFLGVKDVKQFYGATTMTMADTNQTNAMWVLFHIALATL